MRREADGARVEAVDLDLERLGRLFFGVLVVGRLVVGVLFVFSLFVVAVFTRGLVVLVRGFFLFLLLLLLFLLLLLLHLLLQLVLLLRQAEAVEGVLRQERAQHVVLGAPTAVGTLAVAVGRPYERAAVHGEPG